MRKTFLSTLAVVLLLCGASGASAQEAKPVAVISITSYDTLVADVKFVGQLAETPDLDKALEGLIAFGTKGQGLKGLDKSKPLGAAVYFEGGMPSATVFVPTSDLKGLLTTVLPAPPEEKDGVMEISPPNGQTVYAVQKGAWAFISNNKESLKATPADPTTLLDGLDKNYAVAVRFNIHNIPEETRNMGVQIFKSTLEASLAKKEGEDETTFELRKKFAENQMKQIETFAKDLDAFTMGWAIDPTAKSTHVDISLTAVAGTDLAKKMASISNATSNFGGFLLPDSAMTFNFTSKLAQDDIEQLLSMLSRRANEGRHRDRQRRFDSERRREEGGQASGFAIAGRRRKHHQGRQNGRRRRPRPGAERLGIRSRRIHQGRPRFGSRGEEPRRARFGRSEFPAG